MTASQPSGGVQLQHRSDLEGSGGLPPPGSAALAEGVLGLYDEKDDGLVDEPELVEIGDDMGVAGFWDN